MTLHALKTPLKQFTLHAICALVVLLTHSAVAQEVQQITFDEAVRIALDQNFQLRQSRNSVRLQEVGVQSARAAFLPTLNTSSGGGRSFGLYFDQNVGERRTTQSDYLSIGASTGITLFQGFRDFARLKQSQLAVTASDFSLERQRQVVVFTVAEQFLTYIELHEQIAVQQENLAAQQQLLTQIEEFVRVGTRPVSDLYAQRAQVASAEYSILEIEHASQLAEARLIQTLQLDPFGVFEFVVPEVEEIPLVPESFNLDELMRHALDRRADLRAQETMIGVSEQGIREARGGRLPSLSMSVSAGTSFSSGLTRIPGNDFGEQLRNNRSERVGFSIQIPFFRGFATRSAVQRARIDYENARLSHENLRQNIGVEVREAYQNYVTAEKQLQVTDEQLAWRDQALEAARERYNVGAGTLVELTQAQSDYVSASHQSVRAKYAFFVRKRLIDYYTGALDPSQPLFE